MIVVFDSHISPRAEAIRYKIFRHGFPCAVCDSRTIETLCPIGIIITFVDQLEIVRHLPYDDIMVIAYGVGFVNGALNAVKAESVDEVLSELNNGVLSRFGLKKNNKTIGQGFYISPGVFLSKTFLAIYGNRFYITDKEFYIISCLFFAKECSRSAKQLVQYCTLGDGSEGSIRTHICEINKKVELRLKSPLIEYKSRCGYRLGFNSLES